MIVLPITINRLTMTLLPYIKYFTILPVIKITLAHIMLML